MGGIVNGLSSIMGFGTNSKPLTKLGKKFIKDPEKALAALTVSSIVIKDGIGCVMYVTQSLHNKKIPEEKRKFVAALDLTNGVLMIAAQIAMFLGMRKYSGKIFDGIFKKSFNTANKLNSISRYRMQADVMCETVYKKLVGGKKYDKFKKSAYDVFKFCLDIAAATIIGKRVIVPLIATPLANKVKDWMNKDEVKSGQKGGNQKEAPVAKVDEAKVSVVAQNLDTGSTNLLAKYKQK